LFSISVRVKRQKVTRSLLPVARLGSIEHATIGRDTTCLSLGSS
jgi:hypothetical protein